MTPSSKSVSDGVCEKCTGTGRVRDLNKMCCHAFANCGCDSMPCPFCQPQQEKCACRGTCDRWEVHTKNHCQKLADPGQSQQEPMNQDNQVGWEVEMMQFAEKYMPGKGVVAPSFFVSDLSRLIGLVKRDSYAEGTRRARERVAKLRCDCGGKDDCNFHDFLIEAFNAFDQLEEEVKK